MAGRAHPPHRVSRRLHARHTGSTIRTPRTRHALEISADELAQCGECGHGLLVRSRKGAKGRTFSYVCGSYHTRGRAVCSNDTEIPIDDAHNIVLESLLDDIVTPDVVEDAVNEALGLIVGDERTTDTTTTRIVRVDADIAGSSANATGSQKRSPLAGGSRAC